MKNIFFFLIFTVLAGCSFLPDAFKDLSSETRTNVTGAIVQGRNAANDLRKNAQEIKSDIEKKIDDIDQAVAEIREAKEAINRVFNTSIPQNISYCTNDLECIEVEYKGCCTNKTVINTKYLSNYKDSPQWQKDSTDCRLVDCSVSEVSTFPKCLADSSGIKKCLFLPLEEG